MKDNLDVFACEHADMEGIDPKVTCHRLNTSPDVKLRQQRRHSLNLERYKALAKEVDKLFKCDFIRESLYPRLVANSVLTSIKGQALADFLIEFSPKHEPSTKDEESWTHFVDGSSTKTRARARVVLMSPDLEPLCQSLRFDFHASNNMDEYEALIISLRFAKRMGALRLLVYIDSQTKG
ncbi:Ribonuclease H [Abeliophyllum distichum]|uniref:Ribonuclease H n=1 Tax=Abeliophyllum distichum TaxID=126358 RepID=A0ABD1SAC0_9LAMI